MASGIVRSDPSLPAASCTIPPHEDTPLANGKRGMSSAHRKIHSLSRKTAKLCNENVSISFIFLHSSCFFEVGLLLFYDLPS